MLFFAHLFTGLLAGLLLSDYFRERRLVPVCMFASVLPDLFDKPVGQILLHQSLDNGRILFHGLFFVVILLVLGLLLLRRYPGPLLIGAALAVFTHQLLDAMWNEPATWFFPFFGGFPRAWNPDFFLNYFWIEVGSLSEWIFGFAVVVILALEYSSEKSRIFRAAAGIRPFLPPLFIAAGTWTLLSWPLGFPQPMILYVNWDGALPFLGLLYLAGAAFLIRRDRKTGPAGKNPEFR
jgi:membrane-bound metal-dependent hydrolase YbcI (DUF457 family)